MILRRKPLGTDTPAVKSHSKLQKRRALRHELLEERRLLAVGPQLLGIDHNNGVLIQEGSIFNTAPRELTFRFDEGQVLDRATLGAIQLVRSGNDGVFDNGNDVTINPGYLDLGQTSFSVVMRFNQTLVDDMYRVQIIGEGTSALRNAAGMAFGDRTMDNIDNGKNFSSQFDLQLGAKVISVVPQPVTRDPGTGVLTQAKNKIEVYFNNDALNATSASTPAFYRLIDTQDQSLLFPQSVAYDAVANVAVLTFANDLSTATFHLQIGESDEGPATATGAVDLGTISQQARAATYDSPVLRDVNGNVLPTIIPDGGAVISAITVADSFLISDLNVELDIDHSWGPDLRIFLTGPAGQRVELIRDVGSQVRGGQIYGVKYNDLDGDGQRDTGEPGQSGWTLFIDANNNGELDAGERSTVTDSQGRYSFLNLDIGQSYNLVEILQPFALPTNPVGGIGAAQDRPSQTVFLGTGPQQQIIKDVNFGTSPITVVGPDAYGYQAYDVTSPEFEDITATGKRILQQFTDVGYALQVGGSDDDVVSGMARDAAGNLLIAGSFHGTVDFDPGAGSVPLTSSGGNDIFVAKYAADGTLLWAKKAGGTGSDVATSVAVDNAGNVVVSGSYSQTADIGGTNLTSNGSTDAFLWKLDSAGNSVWARGFGSTAGDGATGVDVTSSGDVVATGFFSGTVDFDPSAGIQNQTSAGSTDAFVLRLSAALGNLVWVRQMGGVGADRGENVNVAPSGNITTTGSYTGTVDFNPGAGINNLSSSGSADGFIQQLTSAGNYRWAQSFGSSTSADLGNDVTSDASSNVYVTGVSNNDIWVRKLNANGGTTWTRTFGGTATDIGESIDVAADGSILVSGSYRTTVNFGSGNKVAAGGSDGFLLSLNGQGNYTAVSTFGGALDDSAFGAIREDADSYLFAGTFRSTVTFDVGTSIQSLTSNGGSDAFFARAATVIGLDDGATQLTSTDLDGFNFNFYGTDYDSLYVSSNGLISFEGPNISSANTDLLSSPTEPIIAAFWEDLRTGAADFEAVFWQVFGTGNDQRLVVQWSNVQVDNANAAAVGPLDFEAVLYERDGSIQFNYRAVAGPQIIAAGPETPVGTFTKGSQSTPSIASDAAGNYVMVWNSPNQDGDQGGIYGRRYNAVGNPLGAEFRINETTVGNQMRPQVAMNSSGRFIVSWDGSGTGDADLGVFARVYNPSGVPATGEFAIPAELTGTQINPSVGIDNAGNFVIAWSGAGTDDASGIYARRFNSAGVPQGTADEVQRIRFLGPPAAGSTFTLIHAGVETAPIAFTGTATGNANNIRDALRALPNTGSLLTVTARPDNDEVQALNFIGSPASGTIVLSFNSLDTLPIIFEGAAKGAETATNIQAALEALVDVGAGNVTVAQVGTSDTEFTVTFTGTLAGTDQPLIVLRTNSLDQGSLAISETTSGSASGTDFEVTFLGIDGATNQPLLSHGLTQNGVTHLQFTTRREGSNGQIRVNNFLTNTQSTPRLDMSTTGEFNISWTSANQDGNSNGVFAKRFDANGMAIAEEFDEVQRLTLNGPPNPGSTYRLRMGAPGGATTGIITYAGPGNGSQSAANIQAALRALPNLDSVTVTPVPGTSNEVQFLNFTGFPLPQTGTVRLAHRGVISDPILFAGNTAANAATTATSLQDALRLITGSTTLTVVPVVVGGNDDPYRFIVTFIGAPVEGLNQPQLVLVDNQLNQGTLTVSTISEGGQSDDQFIVGFNGTSGRVDQPTLELALNTGGVAAITAEELTRGVNSEFQINSETIGSQTSGDTAIRADGSFFYVWNSVGQDGDGAGIFGKLFAAGGNVLRDEFQINTYTQSSQATPQVDVDASGNLVVTWRSLGQDGDSGGIYARRLGADAFPLGDEFQVHTLTIGNQANPDVTINPNGSFVTAWQTAAGGGGIHAQRFDATGAKVGSEAQVSQYGVRSQAVPEIARAANGNYVLVWQDENRDADNSSGIYGQLFNANGTPLSAEFTISSANLAQTDPSVDIDDAGNFVVVWSTAELDANNNTIASLRGRRFDPAGNPLAAEFVIATNVLSSADVDVNPTTGDFVVVWNTGSMFGPGELHGRVFNASGIPQTTDLTLSSLAAVTSETPRVAMQANGQFMVVQMVLNGSSFNISGQLFAADGSPLAAAFTVNDIDPSGVVASAVPDIVVDSNGKYSVVWYTLNQNTNRTDAYLRQFDASGAVLGTPQQLNAVAGNGNDLSVRISVGQDNSLVATWVNESTSTGVLVQKIGATGKLVGANTPIGPTGFTQNSPVVAAADDGGFTVAWLDDRLGVGLFQQSFTSDLASVGIKAAGPQAIGQDVLQVWVDGSSTDLVGNNRSTRISRIQQPLGRLFAVNATNNRLLELNSSTGATLKSYPLPVAAGANAGLAYAGGTVYYIAGNGAALYELDPDTGGTVDIMPLSNISTSGLSGLAYLNGEVVLLDATANQLIFVDPFRNIEVRRITPAVALMGGLVGGGARGTLFGIDAASKIIEINATTGAVVATLPSPGGSLVGLALVDGKLLASDSAGAVYQLDPNTGAVSGTLTAATGLAALGADGSGGMAVAQGGDYQPFSGTILDDEASLSITEGVGPYSGRYIPVEPLTAFNGTNTRGDWQLEVRDTATGNTGVLNNWSLRFNEAQDTPPDISYVGYVGDTLSTSATAANDVDLYRFNVVQGGQIAVTVRPTAGLNAVVRLFDAQGNPLVLVNAAGVGGVERLVYTATSAGAYFVGVSSAGNTAYNIVNGSGAAGGTSQGSYTLEVDFSEPNLVDDNNSSFDTSTAIGVVGVGGLTIRSEIRSGIYGPELPGAIDEPGHRDIPPETHLNASGGGSSGTAILTAYYNFQDDYGVLPSGATAVNAITEMQKQRAREIFEMYSQHLGIQFIETTNEGLTVVTGDLRAIAPAVPGGPGGVAGISEGSLAGRVIMDAAENWGDSEYGGGWFTTAMHEIGHSLGLGHAYDLPNVTVMGGFGVGEPVFPGDADLIHGKLLYKPASIDQDLYKFTLNQDGMFTAETVAERIAPNASLLDTVITIYREVAPGRREIVASNDDYFSNDSYLHLQLARGTYYIDVSASGNSSMDPAISDTGFGGTSQGDYELKLNFKPDVIATIVDTDNVALDGDADGLPGGTFSFYFESGPTIFVDKMADTTAGIDGNGSLASPFDNIKAATELARSTLVMPRDGAAGLQDGESFVISDGLNPKVRFEFDDNGFVAPGSVSVPFTATMSGQQLSDAISNAITSTVNSAGSPGAIPLNVTATSANAMVRVTGTAMVDASGSASLLRSPSLIRILGNGGSDRNTGTLADNRPYLLGMDGTVELKDGGTLEVPQGVTVMVDAGALFKLREANFDVGTSLAGVDRSRGALQILGKPDDQVSFYSYRNDTVGGDSDGPGALPSQGDWGGLVFRGDSDSELDGVFLNWVNNATIVSGGGKLLVGSVEETFTPIHLVGSRPAISNNTIRRSADAAISADPASFSDANGRIGPDIHSNLVIENSINGLFVRIRTELGATVDKISIPTRWNDTDIVHVLTENLLIGATPGGPIKAPLTGVINARLDGSLKIDPGMVVKLSGARIEAALGGQLIAEGTAADPIVFTTLTNDAFGGSGTFDTKNDQNTNLPAPGQWGGLFFNATAQGSLDHVLINYGGGLTPIEGGFDRFNAIEIHQADVRLTNSTIRDNADGNAASGRNGRGTNAAATVFVLGAQPTILNNVFQDNLGTVIHINANSLQATIHADPGRSTGAISQFVQFADNYGPLIRLNRLQNNSVNGMEVRGAVLTTESVWDDTDIAHVLRGEISVLSHHTFSGLHLLSSQSESLVVKLAGPNAGFTANGTLLDIDDRIGGSIYIGASGLPVVLTSLADDTAIAGVDLFGQPLGDTNNDGPSSTPAGGDWRGILLDRYSNDRNVLLSRESEPAFSGSVDSNRTPAEAQLLGSLAPDEKSGDVNRQLGFEVHGNISVDNPRDMDVYSFSGAAGTEVFIDVDQTSMALDAILELIDATGTVLARSSDSSTTSLTGLAQPLIKAAYLGHDFYSITDRDPAMRVRLPGVTGSTNTYFVRVRSNPVAGDVENINGGLTRGDYKLQIRLRQVDEKPGSFIRGADIRYATNGIQVIGLPSHSPLIGESAETRAGNDSLGAAQPLGNLLTTDRNTLTVSGNLSNSTDVDWYRFELDYEMIQSISGYNNGGKSFATIFDIDYADGLGRPDTVLSVFDAAGNLILVSRDSNVEDDLPRPGQGADTADLSRGSFGTQDAYIGSVQMPAGVPGSTTTYYVAVSSNSQLPTALNGTFTSGASNTLVRLEPISSLGRIAEDHIGFQGYRSGSLNASVTRPPQSQLFDISNAISLSTNVVPFTLNDVVLYTAQGGTNGLKTVNPFTGTQWTNVGNLPTTGPARNPGDLVMRSDGRMFMVQGLGGAAGQNTAGQLVELDPATGAQTVVGNDGIPDINAATNPPNFQELTSPGIDALAYQRTGNVAEYNLYYSVQGARRGPGVDSASSTLYRANPDSGSATVVDGQPWGRRGEIYWQTPGDMGRTTGMAFIGGTLYGVSDQGYFYQISTSNGRVVGTPVNLGTPFSGLAIGPQNLQNGAFANILFATSSGGQLFALNTTGVRQPVFSGGATVANLGNIPVGLAFSVLDFNLWHPTEQRGTDAGHGINHTFDNTRPSSITWLRGIGSNSDGRATNETEGGLSFRFGLENWVQNPNTSDAYITYGPNAQYGILAQATHQDLSANTLLNNNYNLPGGALGSLATRSISLEGYAAADKPTLYFNYFLETEDQNTITTNQMRDSARVLVSPDGGNTWELLATNNSILSNTANNGELPRFISPNVEASTHYRQQVQELFDNSGGWRQARVDLSNYAGVAQLQFRFDFTTAGAMPGPGGTQSGDPSSFGNLSDNKRGQNNSFEGFYVDDIIVGFSERGEMVTNSGVQSNYFTIPQNPNPADPSQILVGQYQLELRRGTEYAQTIDDLNPDLVHYQIFDTNTRLIPELSRLGDRNLSRDQGQVLIANNTISNSLQFGIIVDSGNRDAGGSLARPGSVRNLPTINNDRLTGGVKVENNIVANFGQGGIRFSGDPNTGTLPLSSVPFGRIMNNTVYGGETASGAGIQITDNASPTVINNIIANTVSGLAIDASSSSSVVGANLFQGNAANGTLGQNAIVLQPTDPLFVNALLGNFYLAFGSLAIDSSLNSLADRPSLVAVNSPLGIPVSPILAPERDRFGQLRLDDPAQDPPPGLGSNIFKDRGAVERADFRGPTARFNEPLDNDGLGLDLNPIVNEVTVAPTTISQIVIQLIDQGIGVDDDSVTAANVQLRLDGVLLVPGTDYEFVYNATNNLIILRALKNNGPVSNRYDIRLINDPATGIRDLANNAILANLPSGNTDFVLITGGQIGDNSIPDFIISSSNIIALEDNELELGVTTTEIPNFASNIPPAGGIGEPVLAFALVSNSKPGLFAVPPAIDINGKLTFVTAPDQNGSAIIAMRLTETGVSNPRQSSPQTFTITLTPVNDAPFLSVPTTLDVNEDQGFVQIPNFAVNLGPGPVTAVDEVGQSLTIVTTALDPSAFTVLPTIDPMGTLRFQTRPDYNSLIAPLLVTVQVTDDGSAVAPNVNRSDLKTFTIAVAPVNDPPSFTLTASSISVPEDNEDFLGVPQSEFPGFAVDVVPGPVTAIDEASQTTTFLLSTDAPSLFSQQPAIDSSGKLTFRTASNRSGIATVFVQLQDSGPGAPPPNQNTSDRATLIINITPVNDPPEFTLLPALTVEEDAGLRSIPNFASNIRRGPLEATDENSQQITFDVVADDPSAFIIQPVIGVDGTLSFQTALNTNSANANFGFSVRLRDNGPSAPPPNNNVSDIQSFVINVTPVNDAPVADAFSATVDEDSSIVIDASDVLVGDLPGPTPDEFGQTLRMTQVQRTSLNGGTIEPVFDLVDPTRIVSFRYSPPINLNGVDTFLYVVTDNGTPERSGTGTISMSINPINDPPTFNRGADQMVNEDLPAVSVANWATGIVAGPPSAVDELASQTVSFTVVAANPEWFAVQPAVSSQGTLTYTLAKDVNGSTTVVVTAVDDGPSSGANINHSMPQTFTISIAPVNDPPVFTAGPTVTVEEDAGAYSETWATGIAAAQGLLAAPPTATDEASQVLHFEVAVDKPQLFSVQPHISSSGLLEFTTAKDAFGTALVTATLVDNGPASALDNPRSAPQTLTISISPENDPPVANDDNYATDENSILNVAAPGILANDTDVDLPDDVLQVVASSFVTDMGAQVTLNADGSLTYDPTGVLVFQQLTEGQSVSDTFVYRIKDSAGEQSNEATVNISINGVNDAPVAVDDSYTLGIGQPLELDILTNDTDVDSIIDPLSIKITSRPGFGTTTVSPTGIVTYTPEPGFRGNDSFRYTVKDSTGMVSNEAQVLLIVNSAPVAANDSAFTFKGDPVIISVLSNDFDSDGFIDTNSVRIEVSPAPKGSVEVLANGTLRFTPAEDFAGEASFAYSVKDNSGTRSNVATVSIRVQNSRWQNPQNSLDVNDDGFISPIDALLIINYLNAKRNPFLPSSGLIPPPYIDTNGDELATSNDVMQVINYLNENSRGKSRGEGEASGTEYVMSVTPQQMVASVGLTIARELMAARNELLEEALATSAAPVSATVHKAPVIASYASDRRDEELLDLLSRAAHSNDSDSTQSSPLAESIGSALDELLNPNT